MSIGYPGIMSDGDKFYVFSCILFEVWERRDDEEEKESMARLVHFSK